MKFLVSLLILTAYGKAFGAHMTCQGRGFATATCAAQNIRLELYTDGNFELESYVPNRDYYSTSPNDPCYRLSSGKKIRKYNAEHFLSADRIVRFFPNYGGFKLKSNIIVGDFYHNGKIFGLRDRMTGQNIQLFCK